MSKRTIVLETTASRDMLLAILDETFGGRWEEEIHQQGRLWWEVTLPFCQAVYDIALELRSRGAMVYVTSR
jgi:hypothetical protein